MTRPSVLADWATATNYSAGTYSGQTNKSAPPPGNVAEGFNAGYGLPIEWLNYMLNNHGSWINYLDTASGPIWGDGSDGAQTLDGAATILGMAPVANVYTMTRDLCFTDLTINTGITLKSAGFRIYGTGTLTMSGTAKITCNGANGGAGTGFGGGHSGILGAAAGGDGAAPDGAHGAGVAVTLTAAIGTAGGTGGTGDSGGGGSSTRTAPTPIQGSVHLLLALTTGMLSGASGITVLQGGAGGGSGGGDVGAGLDGGYGGGGGGVILIVFRSIALANTSQLEAKGGNGTNGAGGGTGQGGGGGGGAGAIIFVYHVVVSGTTPVTVFTGGTHGNGAGTGTNGTNGTDGSASNLYLFQV